MDSNQDGLIGIDDMLTLLSAFGDTDYDQDGVWDSVDLCVDDQACNYEENPSVDCLYNDALGVCGGYCTTDSNGDGVCDFGNCGDPVTFNGWSYETIELGGQCWFAENLKTTSYNNGSLIPLKTGAEFEGGTFNISLNTGARCAWWNDESNAAANGYIYNWLAVNDDGGLCPLGWHVPTLNEWETLDEFLYENEGSATVFSSNVGIVSESGGWWPIGIDCLGPSGFGGVYWTSTVLDFEPLFVWHYAPGPDNPSPSSYTSMWWGHAVRCIKD